MNVLFPTAYFGSIAYYQLLAKFESVSIEIHDHFPKQTLRNRTEIIGAQGRLRLSIPVIRPNGSKSFTHEISTSEENWQIIHWRSIFSAYASAPYFEHYESDIKRLIFQKKQTLLEFNTEITRFMISVWELKTQIETTQAYIPPSEINSEYDFRSFNFEKITSSNTEKYQQVLFTNKQFHSNASVLDLLFCEGPIGRKFLL